MNTNSQRIRVLVVDDHDMVRLGLKMYIDAQPDLEWIGEVASGTEAVAFCLDMIASAMPDVILMDLIMPGANGIVATQKILEDNPTMRIVILSSYLDEPMIKQALEAGACGYILKNATSEKVTEAIRTAYAGKVALSPEIADVIVRRLTTKEPLAFVLSLRETEVLSLMCKGMNNRQIAEHLVISYSTVRFHVSSILNKLGVSNRVEAVTLALQRNMIT